MQMKMAVAVKSPEPTAAKSVLYLIWAIDGQTPGNWAAPIFRRQYLKTVD